MYIVFTEFALFVQGLKSIMAGNFNKLKCIWTIYFKCVQNYARRTMSNCIHDCLIEI